MIAAHDAALTFGGRSGIRDQGSIESATAPPYTGYYRPIAKKAAALPHSLATNHGFVGGIKRTALYMVRILLDRSGHRLRDDDPEGLNDEVQQMVLDVVEHRMAFDALVQWFKGPHTASGLPDSAER